MNRILTLILAILTTSVVFGQNDFGTINIYRPKNFFGSMVTDHIYFNNKKICELKNGGYLEYKVFTENTIVISVYGTALLGTESDKLSQISLNVERGKNYYFKIFPRMGRIGIEQISEPIKRKKLKERRFVSLTDIGTIYEKEKPDTEWTTKSLKNYWKNNGISDIEGIYERVSAQVEYKLAVLKENGNYKIIYLAGARGAGWREGDIKANLQKTAQFGIFKSGWYMLNKAYNKDIIITFENASMKTISEKGSGQDIFLKMYPTYDDSENNNVTNSKWKSTGTGFFIDKNGYLVTNYHVIDEGKVFEIDVTKNGKTLSYKANVISADRQNDLAILKIIDNSFIPLDNLNYNFSTSTKNVGTSVFALGFPLTQYMGNELKMTDGIISSKSGFKGDITNYQISVPIQPGNSGGPLFDKKGNLVGITSSGLDKSRTDNVNYAIKTSYLKLLIDSLDDNIELPNYNTENESNLERLNTRLNEYVVLIKVK